MWAQWSVCQCRKTSTTTLVASASVTCTEYMMALCRCFTLKRRSDDGAEVGRSQRGCSSDIGCLSLCYSHSQQFCTCSFYSFCLPVVYYYDHCGCLKEKVHAASSFFSLSFVVIGLDSTPTYLKASSVASDHLFFSHIDSLWKAQFSSNLPILSKL
ncbi:hypothetical protein BJ878DRAFT_9350 [Calycina marina]|uniref:Uncharacterized protein n=1 Tax=Calycina marina TaxID=1763456 RepID=A0A9P8CFW6_9HELO|nr:hypothetical protein BJ878DRAFT_9350 [Calycina marina]